MKPELFHIAGLTIYGYGFCILVGIIAAFFHLYIHRVRLGMDVDSISLLSHSQFIVILVVAFSAIGYGFLRRRQLHRI